LIYFDVTPAVLQVLDDKVHQFMWKNIIVFHSFAKIDDEASLVDFDKTRQKRDRSCLIHRENL
jgi:hypothetical protein